MTERNWKAKSAWTMIVKNEEKVLDRCLTSMKGCWDPGCLLIVDTGSTDRTIEIAKDHGAIVENFKWILDFGAARQYSLNKLYEHFPNLDWWGWCDADDILMSPDDVIRYREILDQYLDNPKVTCLDFPYIYSHEKNEIGNQGLANFKYHRLRCCKNGTGIWRARIHEYIESDMNEHAAISEVLFHHFREGTGVINTKRNLEILKIVWEEATEQERPRYSFYLGKEYTYNGFYDEAIEMFKTYLPISTFPAEKTRALYELANCYKIKGKIEEAKRWAFEAIIADQRYPDPFVLLCQIAYEQKDWKMCIAWAEMIPHLGQPTTNFFDFIPNSTYIGPDYCQAAWHYLGDNKKATEHVLKCLSYKPHERRYLKNYSIFTANEMPKTGIIIPTLNRKTQLINCVNKIKENAYLPYEILIGVDGNEEYFNELNEHFKDETQMTIALFAQKVGVPVIVEDLVDVAKEHGCKYVTYLGDDTEPLVGFLVHAQLACEDKNLVCYNDKVWNGEIACHWFAPIDLRDKLGGFFFYKGYNHVGCDNELTEKAKAKGLYKYEEKAYVDHIHYIQNICSDKNRVAELDECYKLAWDEEKIKKDRELLATRKANNWLADTDVVKINLGSGSSKHEGYITLDKFCKADIKADILEAGLFKPETVDKFLMEHVLEHFTSADGAKVLKVCFDALKIGGEIEVSVPDVGRISEVADKEYATKVMYGWRDYGEGMFHLFGYTSDSLVAAVQKAGFEIVKIENSWEYDSPSVRISATK